MGSTGRRRNGFHTEITECTEFRILVLRVIPVAPVEIPVLIFRIFVRERFV
jgi:hypothetical protein